MPRVGPPGVSAQGILGNVIIVTLTFSIAEEIGWRGYLLPRLTPALGNPRGMALTGLLHGVYHLPLILLTTYYHAEGNRLISLPMFLAAFTVGGLLYGLSATQQQQHVAMQPGALSSQLRMEPVQRTDRRHLTCRG